MLLAKPAVDVGLSTNNCEDHLAFWRENVGLAYDSKLPVGDRQIQHRFNLNGSVLKVNVFTDRLGLGPRTGYREVMICQTGRTTPLRLSGPDETDVMLIPPGYSGIEQMGVRIAVRDIRAHRDFYRRCLGLKEKAPNHFLAGETHLLLEEDPAANPDASQAGSGWRYITFQVFDSKCAHAQALAQGAREAVPLTTLGDIARFSIIRDPDGNAIELSQRASIVGSVT